MTTRGHGSLLAATPMSATCSLPITILIRCIIWSRKVELRALRSFNRTSPRSTWLTRMEVSSFKMLGRRVLAYNFRGSRWPTVPHKGTLIHWHCSSLQTTSRTDTCRWMLEAPKLKISCSSAKGILATSIVSHMIRLTKTVAWTREVAADSKLAIIIAGENIADK